MFLEPRQIVPSKEQMRLGNTRRSQGLVSASTPPSGYQTANWLASQLAEVGAWQVVALVHSL